MKEGETKEQKQQPTTPLAKLFLFLLFVVVGVLSVCCRCVGVDHLRNWYEGRVSERHGPLYTCVYVLG